MKISKILFRLRYWLLALIAALGLWSPWERTGGAHPGTTWLFLAGALARYRALPIAYSSTAVMGAAILLALLAAMLRTWAASSPGQGTKQNVQYLGLWLHVLALSILMPPSGALFAVLAVTGLIAVLLWTATRGISGANAETAAAVDGERFRWGRAILGEIYFWGVAITYMVFASRYNVTVMEQGVLISMGVAVIVQGLLHRPPMPSIS